MRNISYEKLPLERQQLILECGIKEFSSKTYAEASTDAMAMASGISKGSFFHYFKSKKRFYLFCLDQSLTCLVQVNVQADEQSFYGILFSFLDMKFSQCLAYPNETRLLNMAAKEMNKEVIQEKNERFKEYMMKVQLESSRIMKLAANTLDLKEARKEKSTVALRLYVNAIIQRYLVEYQDKPMNFFHNSTEIKDEIREYVDFMLHGIERESQ